MSVAPEVPSMTADDESLIASASANLVDRRLRGDVGNAALRAAFPMLVNEWRAYWRQQPWHSAVAESPDALIEVLRALLDAAMVQHDNTPAHDRLLRAALAHGEQRRADGVTEETLLGEYHALRKALWRYLLRSETTTTEDLITIFRVDVVMTAASGLALRGYMRTSVDAAFPWEQELARTMASVSAGLTDALGQARS
jgi:hypothetical protein